MVAAIPTSAHEGTPAATVRRYRLVLQELRAGGGSLIDEAPIMRKPARETNDAVAASGRRQTRD
jgi:hypothetical protein